MFGKKREQPEKAQNIKIIGLIIVAFNALGCLFLYLHPKRWHRFLKGEKREIKELSGGEETASRFFRDSADLLINLFIPNIKNSFKPKILRPKSLLTYALAIVAVKVLVTGFLFFTYPSPAQMSAIISANMISLINQSRLAESANPLKENPLLSEYARQKAEDMIKRDYFAHDTPEGKRPWQWIDKDQYDYVYAGENLAMDFSTAEAVQDAFMKSPSHKRNIVNPKYQEVGIAVLYGKLSGHPTTLLVEFFGTKRQDLVPLVQADKPLAAKAAQPAKKPAVAPTIKTPVAPPSAPAAKPGGVAGEEIALPEMPAPAELAQLPSVQDLNAGISNNGIIIVNAEKQAAKTLADWVIEYSNIFFIAFLIFILISLGLNIFVKIQVQHPSVILQSAALIALLLAMILVKFHFAETVTGQILIL